jgi:hypothetical protein
MRLQLEENMLVTATVAGSPEISRLYVIAVLSLNDRMRIESL